MWSLFRKKEEDIFSDEPDKGIFDYSSENSETLAPLKFSNNKTQEDVVKEVLDAINSGNKLIFIKGVCGTGKSAIALNIARQFKKSSIVVPIKNLQKQYEKDYTKKMFLLNKDKNKMNISIIKGRNNFSCPFLGGNADANDLPCTIELREKNLEKIKQYIAQNKNVDKDDFQFISDVRRISVAPACPYWSPLLPAEVNAKALRDTNKKKYIATCGKEYALFQRKKGCQYYDQYTSYSDSEVLIFNSRKYLIELAIGRKPKTDIDIIDECDEFLDNFAEERKINLNRLHAALSNLFPETRKEKNKIKELIALINDLIYGERTEEIQKIKQTEFHELFKSILDNPYLAEDEDRNYYNNVFEIVKSFEKLTEETYISYNIENKNEKDETTHVSLVSINLAQKFQDIIDSNNVLVLMSGTLHSEQVLKDIFGLEKFKTIEAETITPGTISKFRMGLEKNCKYPNFKSGDVTREDYLKALEACINNAKPPTLVHVSAFKDLPTELEKVEYKLESTITREKIKKLQEKNAEKRVDDFKSGETDLLFTTRCSRGVDFPGEKCNSIILTKYPYPNTQSLFWKILKKEKPDKFLEFYLDKAKRELLQRIYRGLRFKDDHIILLSPDSRILDARLK